MQQVERFWATKTIGMEFEAKASMSWRAAKKERWQQEDNQKTNAEEICRAEQKQDQGTS